MITEQVPVPENENTTNQSEIEARRLRIKAVVGIWEDRYQGKSTDEIMKELRADLR
jgi:hypothetical protein